MSSELSDVQTRRGVTAAYASAKVPEITVWFWVVKILSTAMGEALSDFLDGGAGILLPVLGVLAALVAFLAALRWQLRARSYSTVRYWLTVAMVATFGTMAADAIHQALDTPYWVTSLGYAIVLTVIFVAWYRVEGTLSIHSITTPRREWFYWATVLATFALGTAVGDMSAGEWHLGYLSSGLLFSGLILVPLLVWRLLPVSSVLTFWCAYVLTRPMGASYADWMDVPARRGGLGWGTGPVALVLVVVITVVVALLARSGRDHAAGPDPR